MTGHFGKTSKDDGVTGVTSSASHAGVVGENKATSSPPVGTPGGSGVLGLTAAPAAAGVFGASTHASKGVGVQGNGPEAGLSGYSATGTGLRGHCDTGNGGELFAHAPDAHGLLALNDATAPSAATDGAPHGCAVCGVTTVPAAAGLFGANNAAAGVGVQGNGPDAGLSGYSAGGAGARAFSVLSNGIEGFAEGPSRWVGVFGGGAARRSVVSALQRDAERAVHPVDPAALIQRLAAPAATARRAVVDPAAQQRAGAAVGTLGTAVENAVAGGWLAAGQVGRSRQQTVGVRVPAAESVGVRPIADTRPRGNGVWGHTKVPRGSGVFGSVEPGLTDAAGVTGIGPIAGQFFGNVVTTGDVHVGGGVTVQRDVQVVGDVVIVGADVAEDFDVDDDTPPGTVLVIDDTGGLTAARHAYDKTVAGVVSGAGDYAPGVVLDRGGTHTGRRVTVALVGKVFCRVDATAAPIVAGDLLTTSATPGHAMRAGDRERAFGAILGKALRPLRSGRGLIPVLVTLG